MSDERALPVVTGFVRRAAVRSVLRRDQQGTPRWTFARSVGLELPLFAIATAAAELLTSPDLARVKACPGNDCGWLFIDRPGRRRWCSMATCGNRAKVAAHSQRQRELHPRGSQRG